MQEKILEINIQNVKLQMKKILPNTSSHDDIFDVENISNVVSHNTTLSNKELFWLDKQSKIEFKKT